MGSDLISFFIPGEPVPTGRGRAAIVAGHAHVFTPRRTRDYQNLVRLAAAKAMNGRPPLDTAVVVGIEIWLPIPASMSKRKREHAILGALLPAKKPDLDNCIRSCTDGMSRIVYRDDALIVSLYAGKRYSDKPGVSVKVRPALTPEQWKQP